MHADAVAMNEWARAQRHGEKAKPRRGQRQFWLQSPKQRQVLAHVFEERRKRKSENKVARCVRNVAEEGIGQEEYFGTVAKNVVWVSVDYLETHQKPDHGQTCTSGQGR